MLYQLSYSRSEPFPDLMPVLVHIRGGGGRIRTSEVVDDRFTVCSLWPLGNPPTKSTDFRIKMPKSA